MAGQAGPALRSPDFFSRPLHLYLLRSHFLNVANILGLDGVSPHQNNHSLLNASTGSIRAARQAGRKPETTPVTTETITEMMTMPADRLAGNIHLVTTSVAIHAMAA